MGSAVDEEQKVTEPQPLVTGEDADHDSAAQPDGDSEESLSGFRLISCLAALLMCNFVVSLDMTILATAIPRIVEEFSSLEDIGWYGSSFFLTISAFSQFWGKAYTYFSLKWVLMTAIVIFEVGSLICGVAKNSPTLIIGRAITGAGGAGISNGCYTIIGVVAKPEKRPAYTGILAAMYGFAAVIGPLIGGAFTTNVTWRWCFYLNLPIGGIAAFILLFVARLPSSKMVKTTTKEALLNMDLVGAGLIMAAFVCYLLPLQQGGTTKSWRSPTVIGLLVGFVLLLALFTVHQLWLGERAMMVPRLMKQRRIISLALFNLFMAGSFFTFVYYLPIYFQVIGHYSALGSAVQNLPLILGSTVFGIVAGVLMVPVGRFHIFLISGAALVAVGGGLTCTLQVGLDTGKHVGYQLLVGVGAGLCLQVPVMVGQAFSLPADVASTTAILLFFQTMGGTIVISASQSIFTNGLVNALNAAGFHNTSLVLSSDTSHLSSVLTADEMAVVLPAYLTGLRNAWAMATACGGAALLSSAIAKFENIKNVTPQQKDAVAETKEGNKHSGSSTPDESFGEKGTSD
ncbi:Putative major facilitator superfamily, MFS transporter superfamily [Colletotrichum destructivum]|uniref:Major facilitator superfamily, MFS transporter superfamily n=1 Tax=Colletotrichum destructivum TaxID=34406 RepID=A0AAX4IT92_9PEZI|nr:Putative major facilitator superfamily, MFS transporter superfamily [Colletotrichum destructivum]